MGYCSDFDSVFVPCPYRFIFFPLTFRNLRSRLYAESYEIVKQQRIKCLLRGAWFPISSSPATNTQPQQTMGRRSYSNKKWRFYRLSPNRKFLHYGDFMEKVELRDGVEDLMERSKWNENVLFSGFQYIN